MRVNRRLLIILIVLVVGIIGYLATIRIIDTSKGPRGTADRAPKPRTHVARQRAFEYWGRHPCNGDVTYTVAWLPAGQYGRANWTVSPRGDFYDCRVTFSRRVFGHGTHAPFPVFCGVMVHEIGHLLGKHHVKDPSDVMYPTASSKNIPAVCKRDQQGADTSPIEPGGW